MLAFSALIILIQALFLRVFRCRVALVDIETTPQIVIEYDLKAQ